MCRRIRKQKQELTMTPGAAQAPYTGPEQRATFVIVHGGWGCGFTFAGVAGILLDRGHRVHMPALTGLGRRSHLLGDDIGLATHIEDVVNEIRWDDLTDVVLVGHSYGGMVITGVADAVAERIASIVYLDAFLPADGQSTMDLAVIPEVVEQLDAARDRGETSFPFPPEFAAALGIAPDDLWKFTPQPLRTLYDPIRLSGNQDTIPKKTFVRAEKWPDHVRVFERLEQDPTWRTVAVPTGHMIQSEAPEQCAAILEEAAP
jgi:pimeloyl-ACP methyl ester carboxylesterase